MIGTGCILSRAPCTKETLSDFHEWCQVTRHSRVFRGLTVCQRNPEKWGVTHRVLGPQHKTTRNQKQGYQQGL